MQIERVAVTGFGCLDDVKLELQRDCTNLVLARNEAGKSTLLGAIEVALYGFPAARTQEGRDLRQRSRPWQGGASCVTVDLRVDKHAYRVDHELLDAAGEPVERWTVRRGGRDVTDELNAAATSPGEWLLRLGRDDFRRSVLVRQGELELVARETAQLVRHLETLVTSTASGVSATEAQERLSGALENYRELAGLEHWSASHLNRAVQWSRVEGRLRDDITDLERQRRELLARRDTLAQEIAAAEEHEAKVNTIQSARARLRVIGRVVQRRELARRLDEDAQARQQLAELEKQIAERDDVAAFPAQREKELHRLLTSDEHLRGEEARVRERHARIVQLQTDDEARRTSLATLRSLVEQHEELRARLALLRDAAARVEATEAEVVTSERELDDAGVPLERLQVARDVYHRLRQEERELIRGLDGRKVQFDQRAREQRQALEKARSDLGLIENRRTKQRKRGLVVGGGLLGAGVLVAATGAFVWGGVVVPLVIATALGLAGGGFGAWLWLGAQRLDAYRYDQLRDVLRRAQDEEHALAQERRRLDERLTQVAAEVDTTSEALLESVQFFLAQRDSWESHEQQRARADDTRRQFTELEQWWTTRAAAVDPQRGEAICTFAEAEALVERVDELRALDEAIARRAEEGGRLDRELRDLREQRKSQHAALARLWEEAGIELSEPTNADGLWTVEELVAGRMEFDRRTKRFAERTKLVTQRDAANSRLLPDEERTELTARLDALDAELAGAADVGSPEEALAALQDSGNGVLAEMLGDSLDDLSLERVRRTEEMLAEQVEQLQDVRHGTWQDARGFLKEYALRKNELDDTLRQLHAELERGCAFAAAIELARETLDAVQAGSYERWSTLLAERLRPLLTAFLPDYTLDEVLADLSPVLVHAPTDQRLDLKGIDLHLSRGAKDRLFLALRLALAQVLGADRGVELPLLLDDPLANWDDIALAQGLKTLAELGTQGHTLLVFTCQRARCEAVVKKLRKSELELAVVEFSGE